MLPTHLTAIRYKAAPDGPWKNALAEGSLNAVTIELWTNNLLSSDRTAFTAYNDGELLEIDCAAVRLPNGRIYDAMQNGYVEEEEAHA